MEEVRRRKECPHCDKTFKCSWDQNRHIREKHPDKVKYVVDYLLC